MALVRLAVIALFASASLGLVACGGGKRERAGELTDLSELEGGTVGVTSLLSTTTLEARYVLQERYGLTAGPAESDVTLREAPAESLPQLLMDGDIDAALASDLSALTLSDDEALFPLSHVAREMRDLTGQSAATSVLMTYPDVARQKGAALAELNRMLATSVTYFRSNRQEVLRAVAADREVARSQLDRWWDGHDVAFGDLSAGVQEGLLSVWRAAKALGDVDEYPRLRDLLFTAPDGSPAGQGRVTVTLAVLDDASRNAALYAIQRGIVGSDLIDVDVTYLPLSALSDAAAARQYDVVETEPITVSQRATAGRDSVVLSGGFVDTDGTLLFTRAVPAD